MAIKLTIAGACGRMGQAIARLALADGTFALAGALEAKGHPALGQDYGTLLGQPAPVKVLVSADEEGALKASDVMIDFTSPEATVAHVQWAQRVGKPLVIGTTGLSAEQQAALKTASQKIAIVFSPNMSIGVNVLFELAALAAQRLGKGYDVEVVEAHHHHKKDAPSGTAKRLAEVLAQARAQETSAIPVHAVRAGDIVGDHTIILAGPAERLELTHRAHSREVFAQGALRAAQFVITQRPGLYDMGAVLRTR